MKTVVLSALILLTAAGCQSPAETHRQQDAAKTTVREVHVSAVLEDVVYQTRNGPINPEDPIPPVVPVAVFAVKTSSLDGPSKIAIACADNDEIEELKTLRKGTAVSFTISADMFIAAGRSYTAGIGAGKAVFWSALKELHPL